jgi:lysozyme
MPLADEIKEICVNEFLVPFEGTGPMTKDKQFFIAYPDPATKNDPIKKGKPWTIGYGLTFDESGVEVKQGDVWSIEKVLKTKETVLNGFLLQLLSLSPKLLLEPPRRVAAILSWCYNLGIGNYRVSTFRRKVDERDWIEAASQCKKWDKANGRVMPGLTRRRYAETIAILNP